MTDQAPFVPVLVLALAFVGYCYIDLAGSGPTRHLPKRAWAVLCLITIPLGGIAYLVFGRSPRHAA
ncbi:PLDc N-terminal domain-containing protein [Intrasporangium sp. DVR]|uniref:PLDc N-terminal domain-containing protein n=1 Tax=Intrasporangium sp. DVR TaxID=3127867 RepID=UPI00313A6249